MKATLFVRNDKNQFVPVELPALIAGYLFALMVSASKSNDQERELAGSVLAANWQAVIAKYANGDNSRIDRIEITDYEVKRNVNGNPQNFPAQTLISNLNMTAILAGLAQKAKLKQEYDNAIANVKALVKTAVTESIKGYEAGKRGAPAKPQLSKQDAEKALRDLLA